MNWRSTLRSWVWRLLGAEGGERLRGHWRAWRARLRSRRAYAYDRRLYLRGSGLLGLQALEARKAHLLKTYHRIEKGLALPQPRPGFGADALATLRDDVAAYRSAAGLPTGRSDWVLDAALDSVAAYLDFHRVGSGWRAVDGVDLDALQAWLQAQRAGLAPVGPQAAPPGERSGGGLLQLGREELLRAHMAGYAEMARARHSVRQFAATPIPEGAIERAVATARYAPSVCNRGAGQVLWVRNAERRRALLALQNGNRGFGDTAPALLVISCRADAFHTVGERYQGWIDGGLFAMSLIHALQAEGLGSCCLNWSVEPELDAELKRRAGLPADDFVIMLLAVGPLPETLSVARSTRRPLNEVLRTLD